MSTDQGAPGTPPPGGSQPPEEPTLDISAEELEPSPTSTPPPSVTPPPAEPAPPSEEVDVTLAPEAGAPAAPAWPAAPVAPPPGSATPTAEEGPEVAQAPEPAAGEVPKPVQPLQPGQPATPAAPVGVAPATAPSMGSAEEWYTNVNGQSYGPYRAEDIRAWLASGQVTWQTLAARAGESNWRPLQQIAEFNPAYAAPMAGVTTGPKDRTTAGILAILLGAFGAHHWYLGNYVQAGIYLGVTVITVGVLSWIPAIAGIIEGIMYLTAPEERFQRKYRSWFMSGPD